MNKRKLTWITFNAFIDTDLYIVRELVSVYEITWYILKSGNDRFEYIKELNEIAENPDIKVYRLQCGDRLRSLNCITFYQKLLRTIKQSAPDVIYTSLAGAPYFIPILAANRVKNKVALAIHNVHVPKGGTSSHFFKLYNYLAIKAFENYQTFSKDQFSLLKGMIPDKNVCYIPFMLKDYGKVNGKRRDNAITFLNFGNIRDYKRIDVLIEAAQLVYEETKKNFRVIIAGKCDNWEKYQNLIKYPEIFELHIQRIDNDMVPELFLEADYFVAPYQDIAQSGSSVVAINYCVPVIASKLPAFEEYIDDKITGRLIEPADVSSLREVMIEIVTSDNADHPAMVRKLKDKKEKMFSVNTIVKQYKEFIDGIANAN